MGNKEHGDINSNRLCHIDILSRDLYVITLYPINFHNLCILVCLGAI